MPLRPPDPHDADVRAAQARGEERVVEGEGVAPGIAIGPALVFASPSFRAAPDEPAHTDTERADDEVERFERAVQRSLRELNKITTFAREKLGESSADI